MAENSNARALFTKFEAEQESIIKRVSQINDQINANAIEQTKALQAHDTAYLRGDTAATEEAIAEVEKLKAKAMWLQRQAQLLSEAGARNSPTLHGIAREWHGIATEQAASLRDRWDMGLKDLEKAQLSLLNAVGAMGKLAMEANSLVHQYGTITTATGLKLTWLNLPNTDMDQARRRGPIYLDDMLVATTYKQGKTKQTIKGE